MPPLRSRQASARIGVFIGLSTVLPDALAASFILNM
jgi:hypothetical protein